MLRKFTIRQRLAAAFVLPVLLMLLLGGAAVWVARAQNQAFNGFNERIVQTARLGEQLRISMAQLRRHEKDAALTLMFPDKSKDNVARWHKELSHAESLLALVEPRVTDADNKQRLVTVREQLMRYRDAIKPVLDKVVAISFSSPDEVHSATREASKHYVQADTALAEALATVETFAGTATSKVNGLYRDIVAGTLALIVLACAALGTAGWWVARSIVAPMREATAFAGRIRDGDLAAALADDGGRDEAAELARTMSAMQLQLARIVGDVRRSADSIQTASSEVSNGNVDLSQRTEQAASNLQRTASSLEQLTGTVKQTANSARTANQLAASAAQVAERGGQVVTQVVGTMGEISASSHKIAEIIGTIDGIAFQTNILALNAAVEAARAGEQGRGFAVVAGEVRSLAQRSAEAAKQIKSLIGASVERVDSGTKLVADAGATMAEIVASVQRVTDIIGEISAAASEQSTGIGQVNTTVTELDRMTQQNAALVEQSAAAAESLKEQAAKLASTVAAFKLEQTAPASLPTLAPVRVSNPAPRAPIPTLTTTLAAPAAPTAHETAARQTIQRARQATTTAAPLGDADWETF
jgi:methyl-accepting chemotaxis protein